MGACEDEATMGTYKDEATMGACKDKTTKGWDKATMGTHKDETTKGWDKATTGMQRQSYKGMKVELQWVGEDMAMRAQRCKDDATIGTKIG
jgi:hypothetical protein